MTGWTPGEAETHELCLSILSVHIALCKLSLCTWQVALGRIRCQNILNLDKDRRDRSSSPLVERRRLRTELKQARLDAGLTQEIGRRSDGLVIVQTHQD